MQDIKLGSSDTYSSFYFYGFNALKLHLKCLSVYIYYYNQTRLDTKCNKLPHYYKGN